MSINLIQQNNFFYGNTPGGTPVNVAYLSPNALNKTLLAVVGWQQGGPTPVVFDSQGNIYTSLTLMNVNGWAHQVFYCLKCKAGANTFTSTIGAPTNYNSIAILEYSGVASVGNAKTNNGLTGVAITTPNITLSSVGSKVLLTVVVGSNPSVTPGGSAITVVPAAGVPPYVEEYPAGNPGNVISPSCTLGSGGNTWSASAWELVAEQSQFRMLTGVGR
jgi:hypothetical protein